MKFPAAIIMALVSSSVVHASFSTRQPRLISRWAARRQDDSSATIDQAGAEKPEAFATSPPLAENATSMEDTMGVAQGETKAISKNWSGAYQTSTQITEVHATINFPHVALPKGGKEEIEYGGSAWVGIDGASCQTTILQTGIDWIIKGGKPRYTAWFEWLPHYSTQFENIDVRPGDNITMKVAVDLGTNGTAGTAWITNETNGDKVVHHFDGPEVGLCETNAEWIVEDFLASGGLEPFAWFEDVTFVDAAYTHAGLQKKVDGLMGSTMIELVQDGESKSVCRIIDDNTLTCGYPDKKK